MEQLRSLWRSRHLPRIASEGGLTIGIASAVLAVAVTTALIAGIRLLADVPNLSMLYLLAVFATGSVFGQASAVVAAIIAFLTFNFFFVTPIFTLHVANPQEWLALLVLLVTAMVIGQLAAALRARAREAETRALEVAALYELSRQLDGDGPLSERLGTASAHLRQFYSASGFEVLLPDDDGSLKLRASAGQAAMLHAGVEQATTWAFEHGAAATPGQHLLRRRWVRIVQPMKQKASERVKVLCLPLMMGERVLGVARLVGYAPERAAGEREANHLRAASSLISQAVDRDRLVAEATEAEVLRRADQVKSALLSSVSHDLRTPLASIKASVTSLLNQDVSWNKDAQQELLHAVDEETDRLTRFVARLLDLSRLESGATQPRKDWHAIDEIIAGVADRLDPRRERVRLQFPSELPLVRVDYVMMEQVIGNLLENALKYSSDTSPVTIAVSMGAGNLAIDVKDSGPGVPVAERDRIFEKFYRAPQGGSPSPGNGIGLAIARGFTMALGGEISYEPNPTGGSIFRVTLPHDEMVIERRAS